MTKDTSKQADHHMLPDLVASKPKRVLIVVANPTIATWPVGFSAAELTHPYYELTERGDAVTIASPRGGKVELDALSDPRAPSKWSVNDLITLGFVNTPDLVGLQRCARTVPHRKTAQRETEREDPTITVLVPAQVSDSTALYNGAGRDVVGADRSRRVHS